MLLVTQALSHLYNTGLIKEVNQISLIFFLLDAHATLTNNWGIFVKVDGMKFSLLPTR